MNIQTQYRLIATVLLTFSGCNYFSIPSPNYKNGVDRLTVSNQLVAKRRHQARQHTLSEKAAIFESNIFDTFKSNKHYLFGNIVKNGQQLKKVDLETTASVLTAISAKYGVTHDEKDLSKIDNIVSSIIQFDAINTLDGYLPFIAKSHSLEIVDNHTHSNAYTQLMGAYLLVSKVTADPLILDQIQNHARLIANYFIKIEFKMRDQNNELINFSDISTNLFKSSRSRILDLLVICEMLNYLLPQDCEVNDAMNKVLNSARQCGYYHKIQTLSIRLFDIHIPTHGSDWLNMLRLSILCEISDKSAYRKAFNKLYKRQDGEFNPIFPILAQDQLAAQDVKRYLGSFPIHLSNQEIIPNTDIALKQWPPYVKNCRILEAKIPVPIYQRPLTTYEWKRNPYRVSGNYHRKGDKSYSGVDFLEAYWLGRYHKLITTSD